MTSDPTRRRGSQPDVAEQTAGTVLPLSFAGDERRLVEALRAGHPGAKAAFFRRYVSRVERIITHVLGYDRELSDILQDVFVSALGSLHTLRDPAALDAWLVQVATRTARKVLRTRTRRSWLRLFSDSEEETRWEPASRAAEAENARAVQAVYALLDRLPTEERIIFALRFIEGMELTETAAASGVSLATVKRKLKRAEQRFAAAASKHPALAEWVEGGSRWQDREHR